MENVLTIESLQNPRVKSAIKLRKSKIRRETESTLVEGYREILRATESGWKFKELYFCPELFIDPGAAELASQLQATDLPLFKCTESVFRKMSYRETPDGLMALSPLVGKKLCDLELPKCPLILIAENLEKPGNLGTILRTADASGVDAVIACTPKTDLNNPNTIRASIGSLFFVPVAEAGIEETMEWLKKHQIQSIAALPDAPKEYTRINMQSGSAIIVGAEDEGLSTAWKESSDVQVSIPMMGRNDSLNVSTAAAILLYEALRQRRN